MKVAILAIVLFVGVVAADVKEIKPPIPIVSQEGNVDYDGTFHYR